MIRLTEPRFGEEEINAVTAVLKSGMLVQGKQVAAFEKALAEYMGAEFVVAVSSGTAALHLALAALGIGPGAAVLVPAFTFPATANVVELQGARPVLVDVDPATYCLTPLGLEQAIKAWKGPERLRAVIPVHEFGAPCDMEGIVAVARDAGIAVVEDAACALGTRYGGHHVGLFGEVGCFSWHPRKAITTGEGGAIVARTFTMYRRLTLLRNHGMERRDDGTTDFILPGFNYRMTEFQAVLGKVQLNRFDETLAIRKKLVDLYRQELAHIYNLRLPSEVPGHSWQTFMVVLPKGTERRQLISVLRNQKIETNLGAQALHMLSYYHKRYGFVPADYPVAAELFERGLALPLHPGLTEEDVGMVASALKGALK